MNMLIGNPAEEAQLEQEAEAARLTLATHLRDQSALRDVGIVLGLFEEEPDGSLVRATPGHNDPYLTTNRVALALH